MSKPFHDPRAVLSVVKRRLETRLPTPAPATTNPDPATSPTVATSWSPDDLKVAVELATSLVGVARLLAPHPTSEVVAKIRSEIAKHQIATGHFYAVGRNKPKKHVNYARVCDDPRVSLTSQAWTDQAFRAAVANNQTIRAVLRELGLGDLGSHPTLYTKVHRDISRLGVDTSHWAAPSSERRPVPRKALPKRSILKVKKPTEPASLKAKPLALVDSLRPLPLVAAVSPALSPKAANSTLEDDLFDLAERSALPYITRRTAQVRAKYGAAGNENRVIRDTMGRLLKALDGQDDLLMQLHFIIRATTQKDARLMGLTVARHEQHQRYLAQCLLQCLSIYQGPEDDGGQAA